VKAWLRRAVESTVRRGPRALAAAWARWFPRSSVVDSSRFQDPDEPFPGHWRKFPAPWPEGIAEDPQAQRAIRERLLELPSLWRAVLRASDLEHRPAPEVAQRLGLSPEQEQHVLSLARAALRDTLADIAERRAPP
jgi:RNA polymerase sigma-70 factor (ECF subfamily)